MFSIFPCFWNVPGRKPIKSLADHHFPPRTVTISRPVPASVLRPATPTVKKPVVNTIPACELLKPSEEIDTTEIDKMLAEVFDPAPESRINQILQMIQTVNQHLDKNIKIIQNAPAVDGDTVSREDLLKLLQMFSIFLKTLEQYIKEQTPSSH